MTASRPAAVLVSLLESHAKAELLRHQHIRHMQRTGQVAALRERAHCDAYLNTLCRELGVELGPR